MRTRRLLTLILAAGALALGACDDDGGTGTTADMADATGMDGSTTADATDPADGTDPTDGTDPGETTDPGDVTNPGDADDMADAMMPGIPMLAPSGAQQLEIGQTVQYTISGLDAGQAYRVTLVVADNLTQSGAEGTFVDDDMNGAADAGASEEIALITAVNGQAATGAKTVPAGDDDPAAPSGIFADDNGVVTLTVTGVAEGSVHPVVYHNGGESTFLEIDDMGVPTEVYAVGDALSVVPGDAPMFDPLTAGIVSIGQTATYTASNLDDAQAYRVTLVVADNITVDGASGTFVDGDMNGAADAGASENIALITSVNGMAQTGAKTVPPGDDDPADPSGIFPVDGEITLQIDGVAGGTVYPVLYTNGGDSTFLEIDAQGVPVEVHTVGGALSVEDPVFEPADDAQILVDEVRTVALTDLDDDQAYRVTLVVEDNVVVTGDDGVFTDADMNGAADAGASENVALVTAVNGTMMAGAKTVPDGGDDPTNPTGVFPIDGRIELEITGVGAGTVYPVAYHNGGASTFLEVDTGGTPVETHTVGGAIVVEDPAWTPAADDTLGAGFEAEYTLTGLDDDQAYRITLVVADNVTVTDGSGVFVDADSNGAADAGASENVANIVAVQGTDVTPAKTVPAAGDDPSMPVGIFPADGSITLRVAGVGEGVVYPVAYHNGGASTFLEVDAAGVPTETHVVGGAISVDDAVFSPAGDTTLNTVTSPSQTFTVTGLDDSQAYRITLVVSANATVSGGMGTFVDADNNGAADAGASENIALVTSVNGTAQTGTKTVPGAGDDPANPTGVFPTNGTITFEVTGQSSGSVYPVLYHNDGASTFLEVDSSGVPVETHRVGGEINVVL